MSSPSPQWFDVLLVDINGICRGYQTPLAEHHNLLTNGLFWPYSLFSLRYDGAVVEETGIGISGGDPDYPCQYIAKTHCPTLWREGGEQAVFSLCTPDGNDFFADPQTALKAILQKFQAEGLSVVLAVELEFYLVDEAQAGAMSELYSFDKLARHRDFVDLIALSAAAQNIKTGSAISEYAPGQFEININHSDALNACLNGVLFRRLVRECARATGRRATFMAKPAGGISGSGMHLHLSLVDKNGGFVFVDEDKLKAAVADVLAVLPESMAFYAPYDNSYRRFVPGKYGRCRLLGDTKTARRLCAYPWRAAIMQSVWSFVCPVPMLILIWRLPLFWPVCTGALAKICVRPRNYRENTAAPPNTQSAGVAHWMRFLKRKFCHATLTKILSKTI